VIHLVGIGNPPLATLDSLSVRIARTFRESCHVRPESLDPGFAFDPVRGQYHATSLLRLLAEKAGDTRLVGVATVDLYVPIFTFVFGEAQLGGPAALLSTFRLRQEYYGLAADPDLLLERIAKEAMHELGHTYGLRHCHDWSCPMASTTAIDRLDLKGPRFCDACRHKIGSGGAPFGGPR